MNYGILNLNVFSTLSSTVHLRTHDRMMWLQLQTRRLKARLNVHLISNVCSIQIWFLKPDRCHSRHANEKTIYGAFLLILYTLHNDPSKTCNYSIHYFCRKTQSDRHCGWLPGRCCEVAMVFVFDPSSSIKRYGNSTLIQENTHTVTHKTGLLILVDSCISLAVRFVRSRIVWYTPGTWVHL